MPKTDQKQRRQTHLTTADILPADKNSFAVVRLLMALSVLVSHCFYLQTGTMAAEPLRQWTCYTLGQHAVQVFFILSGVLVAQSLDRSRSIVDFPVARGLRIFPGLIVCVLMTALIVGPVVSSLLLGDYVAAGELRGYIMRTLTLSTGMATLPGVFDANPATGVVNSSVWTLKYEVLCYAILALGGGLAFRVVWTRSAMTAAFGIWAGVVFWSQPALQETSGLIATARYFLLFFGTGVIAYVLRDVARLSRPAAVALLVSAAFLNGTAMREVALAVALAYGMLVIAQHPLGSFGAFANRTDMSYGVYLYSVPITQIVLVAAPNTSIEVLIVVTAFLSLAVAYGSWSLIEKPALSMRHHCKAAIGTQRIVATVPARTA
jgi:peptidoglycan/LPS O-acetylase OafA/YrhL